MIRAAWETVRKLRIRTGNPGIEHFMSAKKATAARVYPLPDPRDESMWLAVATRSHFEKTVHSQLLQRSIETFLPLRRVTRRWSDRNKIIEEPLFRGYVFVRPGEADHLRVLRTPGVVRFVGPSGATPWIMPVSEMRALKAFVENDLRIDPYPYLKVGTRVRVVRGVLKDIEGFIVRKPRFCRLVISVEMMMQSAAVEINESDVEPV